MAEIRVPAAVPVTDSPAAAPVAASPAAAPTTPPAPTRIKICGLTSIPDIRAANRIRPDYVGFVFAPSRRQVGSFQAAMMREYLDSRIPVVGVFVNARIQEILKLAASGVIQMIQLHGDEDRTYLDRLKSSTDLPVIRAVRVRDTVDILAAESQNCEYLLLDTYTRGSYGGSGRQFDWALIPTLAKPFFLAGGISHENAARAAAAGAFCLDVSSGVETDGRKDPVKMEQMVEAVRSLHLG